MKRYLIPLIAALFFIGVTLKVPLNLKNDLDGNLFHLLFIKQNILQGLWSNWNPYLHQGLPVMSDPINFFWYPLASLVLLLPTEVAVKVIFVVSWMLTATFSYFLFRKSGMAKDIALWLGITYASSGYYLARIVAGHLEKVLSYPIIPLFLLAILLMWQKASARRAGLVGVSLFLLLSTTDMYNFFYLSLGYVVFGIFVAIVRRKLMSTYLLSLFFAVSFAAVRWLPMLSMLGRLFKIPDPYSGSQNLISLFIQIVWPKPSVFSWFVPTNFGWWEKVGFIGPLFGLIIFLPLIWKRIQKNSAVKLAVIFGVVCVSISMPMFALNPWNWMLETIKPLSMFHVPSRVLGALSLCFILLVGQIINRWSVWGSRLVKVNLILVGGYWLFMLNFKLLPTILPGYSAFLKNPPQNLTSVFYPSYDFPANERNWLPGYQTFHTTHGTYVEGSAAADWTNFLVKNAAYRNIIPDYLIWPDSLSPVPFLATPLSTSSAITMYKAASPSGQSNLGRIQINEDKITVRLDTPATASQEIVVYQSYFPEWANASDHNGYIAKTVNSGESEAVFEYKPNTYYLGAFISLLSFGTWTLVTRKYA